MFLGNEIKNKRGAIDWDRTYSEAEKHMAQVGLHESAQTLIKDIGTTVCTVNDLIQFVCDNNGCQSLLLEFHKQIQKHFCIFIIQG